MSSALETLKLNGKTYSIFQDEHVSCPRKDFDHLAFMACWHGRYDLGDKHSMSIEECDRLIITSKAVSLPIYMYDHSGTTIRTYPYDCPWDSGQVGHIYLTREQILKEQGITRMSPKARVWAKKILVAEVEEYDQYLRGEVYGYTVTTKKHCDNCGHDEIEVEDSCWGFYGMDHLKQTLDLEGAAWEST